MLGGMGRATAVLAGWVAAAVVLAPSPCHARPQADAPAPSPPAFRSGPPGPAAVSRGAPVLDLTLREGSHGRDIPWDAIGPENYLRVRDVVTQVFAAREVRDIVFRSRSEVLEFLLDHPDFASEVGAALRRGRYRLRRAGDAYEAADGEGASGRMWLVLRAGGRRIFYVEGRYEGLVLPTFSGRMVVLLDTAHREAFDGLTYCEATFGAFVKLDSGLTEMLARVTRALSEARVDRSVRRFFRHVAAVSRRAYDDPEGLADELDGRPGLPEDVMARFRDVLTGHLPPRWASLEHYRLLDTGPLDGRGADGANHPSHGGDR